MKQPALGIKEMQHFRRYLYKYILTSLDCCNKKLHQPNIHIVLVSVSESFSYIFLITKVELVVCILSMYRDGADTIISLTNKMTQNSWVLGCVGRVKTCVTPPYIFYYRVTNVVGCHYPLSLLVSHTIILPFVCIQHQLVYYGVTHVVIIGYMRALIPCIAAYILHLFLLFGTLIPNILIKILY